MLAAAVAESVVLGSAEHLVDAVVGEADHVERVGDLTGVGQRRVEGAPVRPGEVQHPPVDALASRRGLIQQPRGGTRSGATRDHVEELALGHVDNRGAPAPGAPPSVGARAWSHRDPAPALLPHGRCGRPAALRPRRAPPGSPCASHNPTRRPHRSPGGRRGPPPPSPSVPPAPSTRPERGAICASVSVNDPTAQPAAGHHQRPCVPDEAHRAPERRQIHQLHHSGTFGPHRPAAATTRRPRRPSSDVQRRRRTGRIVDAEDLHLGQTDQ